MCAGPRFRIISEVQLKRVRLGILACLSFMCCGSLSVSSSYLLAVLYIVQFVAVISVVLTWEVKMIKM